MANTQQYRRTDARGIVAEVTREAKKYKNNVDLKKSHLNYNLIKGSDTREQIMQKIDDRVREVMGDNIRKQTKKNMKPLGTWIVTLPQELNGLTDDEKQEFFETTLDFLGDRYGKENLVYASVHNDESQPHMHVGIVPVCISRKTGKETVSAASMFTKKDLINFHKDLDKVMERKYGQAKLINNGRTKGNYTIEELKERKAVEERLTARENSVKEKEQALEEKEKAFKNNKAIADERIRKWNELNSKERHAIEMSKKANEQKEKELQDKELELKAKEQELVNRENEVKEKEIDVDQREIDVKEKETELDQREIDVQAKETEVDQREIDVQAKETLNKNKETRLDMREQNIERKEQNIERKSRKLELDQEQFKEQQAQALIKAQQKLQAINKGIEQYKALGDEIRGLSHALGQTVDKIPQLNTKLVKWAEKQPFERRYSSERFVKTVDRLGVQKPLENIKENIKENSIDIEQIEKNKAIIEDTVNLTAQDFDFLKENHDDGLINTTEEWADIMKDLYPRDDELMR